MYSLVINVSNYVVQLIHFSALAILILLVLFIAFIVIATCKWNINALSSKLAEHSVHFCLGHKAIHGVSSATPHNDEHLLRNIPLVSSESNDEGADRQGPDFFGKVSTK